VAAGRRDVQTCAVPEPSPEPQPARSSRRQTIGRAVVTLVLVGLVFWLLLSNLGDLSEVADALRQVTAAEAALLIIITLVWRLLVATQLSSSVPGLGIVKATVASESSAAASNAIPGPSGTVMRLAVLRSWGYRTEEFANSWLFTSSLTNLTVLMAPIAIVVVLVIEGERSRPLVIAALVGLAVGVTAIAVIVAILRSERFARRVGEIVGRVARWLAGVTRRDPSAEDFGQAAVGFRDGLIATWHRRGPRILLAVVASYLCLGLLFVLSLRAVGLGSDVAPLTAVVAVYCAVRLATMVEITPGGAGITEALYTGALLIVTGGEDQSVIVAGVFLFRGLSYAGPLLLGCVALLVWRAKRSWRVHPPAEDPSVVAVTAVMMDKDPSAGG
jgi:uncharacterized protein (TIRG00374 family)